MIVRINLIHFFSAAALSKDRQCSLPIFQII